MGNVRLRVRIERWLAGICGLLAVSAVIWPDWIEIVFDEAPDSGDGSFEWGMVVVFALAAIAFAVQARRLAAGAGR